jgi:nuclear transport factor 2 (NTF2) superfamily protein
MTLQPTKCEWAKDAWNSRDPEKVAGAYTPDSVWRNRSESLSGDCAARAGKVGTTWTSLKR